MKIGLLGFCAAFVSTALVPMSAIADDRIDLGALQTHLSWCMKVHTSRPGQQGVTTFESNSSLYRDLSDLRYDFTLCQSENPDALGLINGATDLEFLYALEGAIAEIEAFVTKHIRWVAYDRMRAAELLLAQSYGDAAAIRAIYMYEQGANPEARANLKAVSDVFLLRLVATL